MLATPYGELRKCPLNSGKTEHGVRYFNWRSTEPILNAVSLPWSVKCCLLKFGACGTDRQQQTHWEHQKGSLAPYRWAEFKSLCDFKSICDDVIQFRWVAFKFPCDFKSFCDDVIRLSYIWTYTDLSRLCGTVHMGILRNIMYSVMFLHVEPGRLRNGYEHDPMGGCEHTVQNMSHASLP